MGQCSKVLCITHQNVGLCAVQSYRKTETRALECDVCKKWQHRTCNTGITRQQYREAVRDSTEIPFQCNECKQVKERSKQSIFTKSAPAIVEEIMRQYVDATAPEPSRPNPSYLARACNRLRQKERPQDPTDIHQDLNTDFIDSSCPDFFRKDVIVGDRRHLIFCTDRQLQLLTKAKTWYMDATFRVVKAPWMQMFSIGCISARRPAKCKGRFLPHWTVIVTTRYLLANFSVYVLQFMDHPQTRLE